MTKTKRGVLLNLSANIIGLFGDNSDTESKAKKLAGYIDAALSDLEALEPSKEEIYQCIVDYGKTTNYQTRLFNYKDLAQVIHNLILKGKES